ncbi:MAG: ribosome maturation factor RimM [Betaproteobacteria bacterium]|nr:ribosome maturation factor RimM [Betaproteobacteria bacterium]
MIVLGKITGAYGIQGWVRVSPFADDSRLWSGLQAGWLGREERGKTGNGTDAWREFRVESGRWHGNAFLLRFAGIEDRNAAESLVGLLLAAPRERLPQPAEDEYYWGDLEGLQVVNLEGQTLGEVLGLIETGANAVLRVGIHGKTDETPEPSGERLLPFVGAVVREVDLEKRCIRVDWGLDW